jgi:hypothetical protein
MAVNWIMIALPALYAWQVQGFWIGATTFVLLAILSTAAAWFFLTRESSNAPRNVKRARIAIMVLAFVAIAASGAEVITNADLLP